MFSNHWRISSKLSSKTCNILSAPNKINSSVKSNFLVNFQILINQYGLVFMRVIYSANYNQLLERIPNSRKKVKINIQKRITSCPRHSSTTISSFSSVDGSKAIKYSLEKKTGLDCFLKTEECWRWYHLQEKISLGFVGNWVFSEKEATVEKALPMVLPNDTL